MDFLISKCGISGARELAQLLQFYARHAVALSQQKLKKNGFLGVKACQKPKWRFHARSKLRPVGGQVASDRGLVDDIVLGERRLDDICTGGRVRRADLALATDWKEPCTDTECKLAAIWRDIFRVDAVGALDDFFGLGGDSFTATTLAAEIEATFDIRFTPADIINFSTIAQQAVVSCQSKRWCAKASRVSHFRSLGGSEAALVPCARR